MSLAPGAKRFYAQPIVVAASIGLYSKLIAVYANAWVVFLLPNLCGLLKEMKAARYEAERVHYL
jgi:hypothetical protein